MKTIETAPDFQELEAKKRNVNIRLTQAGIDKLRSLAGIADEPMSEYLERRIDEDYSRFSAQIQLAEQVRDQIRNNRQAA